jgi:hypothetical protein
MWRETRRLLNMDDGDGETLSLDPPTNIGC